MISPNLLSPHASERVDLSGLSADLDTESDPFRLQVPALSLYLSAGRRFLSFLRGQVQGGRLVRDESFVSRQYEMEWGCSNEEFASDLENSRQYLLVRGRPVLANGWFIHRRYADLILQAAVRLGARSLLEVGSGRGKNLAIMALRRPDLAYAGVELTTNGVASSRALVEQPPEQYLRVAGLTTLDDERRAALRRIQFHQGNALQLPLPDKSHDVSFTSLVLEQIPRDFGQALDEMRRVTRKYCIFNEAFLEANNWLGRAHLRRVDYFNQSIAEWKKHGLEPIHFSTRLPQKLTHRTGFLVARVVS